jgi:hypothetical protein
LKWRGVPAPKETAVPEPISYIAIGIIIGAVATVRGLLHWEDRKRRRGAPKRLRR